MLPVPVKLTRNMITSQFVTLWICLTPIDLPQLSNTQCKLFTMASCWSQRESRPQLQMNQQRSASAVIVPLHCVTKMIHPLHFPLQIIYGSVLYHGSFRFSPFPSNCSLPYSIPVFLYSNYTQKVQPSAQGAKHCNRECGVQSAHSNWISQAFPP